VSCEIRNGFVYIIYFHSNFKGLTIILRDPMLRRALLIGRLLVRCDAITVLVREKAKKVTVKLSLCLIN
jgi:hypothetical protein